MKFVKTIAIVASMFGVFGVAEAAVAPVVGNQVQVSCTLPSVAGSTVFAIDNSVFSSGVINSITLPANVEVGASCTAVVNAISTAVCTGSHIWTIAPVTSAVVPRKGNYVQQYTFTCV